MDSSHFISLAKWNLDYILLYSTLVLLDLILRQISIKKLEIPQGPPSVLQGTTLYNPGYVATYLTYLTFFSHTWSTLAGMLAAYTMSGSDCTESKEPLKS